MPKFTELGWTKFSILAFASDYVPGSSEPALFVSEVVKPVAGDDEAQQLRYKPLLKRLFTEAYTMASHDVQCRTDAKDEEPRKMPMAEREHRIRLLNNRLTGLNVDDEMRPSNHLIDLCAAMHDTGVVKYVAWEECSHRNQELVGVKQDKFWKPDSNGHIKEFVESKAPDAAVASDLLLKYALMRRGLALEIANVCRYEAHSLLVECLFDAMLAPPLPGYGKVTRNQIRNADVLIWRLIAKECKDGL